MFVFFFFFVFVGVGVGWGVVGGGGGGGGIHIKPPILHKCRDHLETVQITECVKSMTKKTIHSKQ